MVKVHHGVDGANINYGNRTKWSPIRSVIIQGINKIWTTAKRESDLLITSVITGRIGWHDVLLAINHNDYNFPQK